MKTPILDRWYWVRIEDDWTPAICDPRTWVEKGYRWTNGDCWEDFDDEVEEWKLIPLPEELSG